MSGTADALMGIFGFTRVEGEMSMTEVKTADLVGAALDWAVAKSTDFSVEVKPWGEFSNASTGHKIKARGFRVWYEFDGDLEEWAPSGDWSQCGPLIEKHQITLLPPRYPGDKWGATYDVNSCMLDGDSALTAACRAIVAAKLGDVVSVPSELLEKAE